jgi:hypothetical protein
MLQLHICTGVFELTVRCTVPGSDSGGMSRGLQLALDAAGAQPQGERYVLKLQRIKHRHAFVMKETGWVDKLLEGKKVQVDGHFKSKVEHQVQWLMRLRDDNLGGKCEGFIRQVCIIL